MSVSPAQSATTISPGEMQLLLSRTGLMLNPGQIADLVLAWRQVAALVASIPHDRPLADDMALVFRLPPAAAVPAAANVARKPGGPTKPRRATSKVKTTPKAKAKSAPKTRAARAAGRPRVRRGR